ncbi:MAG: hypothetical protein ACRED1_03885 [Limisphaerales bacterium]
MAPYFEVIEKAATGISDNRFGAGIPCGTAHPASEVQAAAGAEADGAG